jgi:hypothetical protein
MDELSVFKEILLVVSKEDLEKLTNILNFLKKDETAFDKTYPSFYTLNNIINQIEMGLR